MTIPNPVKIIGFVLAADLLALFVSRSIQLFSSPPIYRVVDISFESYMILIILAVSALGGMTLALYIPVFKKIRLTFSQYNLILVLAIVINTLRFIFLQESARYTSGGMSGISGLLYFMSEGMTFLSFLLTISASFSVTGGDLLNKLRPLLLMLSYAINIDGLASALTLFCFIIAVLRPRLRISFRTMGLFFVASGLGALGWIVKTGGLEYPVKDFFLWIPYRVAIPIESMLIYLEHESVLAGPSDVFVLIRDSFFNRLDFILTGNADVQGFKTVSAAIFYDLYQRDGGSSPGMLYGSFLLAGYFGFVFFCGFGFLLRCYLSSTVEKFNLSTVIALAFVLKNVYADIPDAFSLISLSLIYFLLFFTACILRSPYDAHRGSLVRA